VQTNALAGSTPWYTRVYGPSPGTESKPHSITEAVCFTAGVTMFILSLVLCLTRIFWQSILMQILVSSVISTLRQKLGSIFTYLHAKVKRKARCHRVKSLFLGAYLETMPIFSDNASTYWLQHTNQHWTSPGAALHLTSKVTDEQRFRPFSAAALKPSFFDHSSSWGTKLNLLTSVSETSNYKCKIIKNKCHI